MLGYRTGAADSPEASVAMARHLVTQTLPLEKSRLAAYYQQPGTPLPGLQTDDHSQATARVRIDTNPELASRLGIDPLKPLTEDQFANLLSGKRADGMDIPGKIKRRSTLPLTEILKLNPESKPKRGEVENILAGKAADGSALTGPGAKGATKRYLRKFGSKGGKPTEAERENLMAGKMANGQELTWHDYKSRVDSSSARIGYVDLCFHGPKSFSIAWARAGTEAERNILDQCFSDAADELMEHVIKDIGQARKGDGAKGGYTPGHVTWVACDHYASRPTVEIIQKDGKGKSFTELLTAKGTNGKISGDPQRHRHYAILNTVMANDGRMVGLDLQRLDDRVKEYGALGQAMLARNLRQHGVEVRLDRKHGLSYLPAVPQWVCEVYSKRTNNGTEAAREYAKSQGMDWDAMEGDAQKRLLKLGVQGDPRQVKQDDVSDWDAWDEQDRLMGYEHKSVLNPDTPVPPMDRDLARKVSLEMLDEQFSKRAELSGGDLRLAAIQGHIEAGFETVSDVNATTKAMRDHGVLQDGKTTSLIWGTVTIKGRERIKATTALHEAQENELVTLAREGWSDKTGSLGSDRIAAAVERYEAMPLDQGGLRFGGGHGTAQRAAMDAVGTGGRVSIVIGVAGSGKTSLLKPLVQAWKAEGRDVHGIALAWRQADNLTGAGISGHHARAVAKFMHPNVLDKMALGPKSVVVVDEVGLLGTRELLNLLKLRKEKGFSLVMLGDPKQCQSVEAGPVISLLERALGEDAVPKILTTVRQRTEREKEIVTLFREGRAGEALDEKMKDKHVHIVPGDYTAAVRKVADLWQAKLDANSDRAGYSLSISAPTNDDARAISLAIRDKCQSRGLLKGKTVNLDAIDQRGAVYNLSVAVGDKLRLFKNTRASFAGGRSGTLGRNASVVEVIGIQKAGLVLRNEHGTEGLVSWEGLRHKDSGRAYVNYGYVLTTFSSQSSTVTDHIHAMPGGTKGVQGFEAYTSGTRHVETSEIVVSDGAERRDIQRKRPMGDSRPVREWDVLQNMATNLSRQPEKVSALAMLEKAKNIRRGMARALQQGLRRGEQNQADGKTPTTLEQTFAQRREEKQVEAVIQDVAALAQAQDAVVKAVERLPRQIEQVVDRAIENAGPAIRGEPILAARRPTAPVWKEDPVTQFGTALRQAGLMIQGEPIMDGKRRRVQVVGDRGKETSGSYVGYSDGWPAGHITNFKDTSHNGKWKADGVMPQRSREDAEEERRQQAASRHERRREVLAAQEGAAALASKLWEGARPATTHPYLDAKGVQAHGVRLGAKGQSISVTGKDGKAWKISMENTLLIPMHDKDGALRNVQMIDAKGGKRFLGGGQKVGLSAVLGDATSGGPLLIAEGYATAATMHEATGRPVVVAFDAGNILPVTQGIMASEPWRELVICADNDCHLPLRDPPKANTGLEKANIAADETGAVVLVAPEIAERTAADKGTDWNDYAKENGLEAVQSLALPVIQKEHQQQMDTDDSQELGE